MTTFFRRFEVKSLALLKQNTGTIVLLSIMWLILSVGLSRFVSTIHTAHATVFGLKIEYFVAMYIFLLLTFFVLYNLALGKTRNKQYSLSEVIKKTDSVSLLRFVFLSIIRHLPFFVAWCVFLMTYYLTTSIVNTIPLAIVLFCIASVISSRLLLASAALIDTGLTIDSALNRSFALTKTHELLCFFLVIFFNLSMIQITVPYAIITYMLFLFRWFFLFCSIVIEVALYLTCIDDLSKHT